MLHSPAAGAAAPPEPAPAEEATATAPPAGMLASLLKPEDTGVVKLTLIHMQKENTAYNYMSYQVAV